MKKVKIFILVLISLIICGCQDDVHKYEDFIEYIDNMNCNINSNESEIPCTLKNKYEIISDETITDPHDYRTSKQPKIRTMKVRIKNTDLEFEVVSRKNTSEIPTPAYILSDNYYESMSNYYYNKYIYLFQNNLFKKTYNDSLWFSINISTKQNFDDLISYLSQIQEIIKNDNMKYNFKVPVDYKFHITFNKKYINYQEDASVSVELLLTNKGYEYKIEPYTELGYLKLPSKSITYKEDIPYALERAANIGILRKELAEKFSFLEDEVSAETKYYGFENKEGYISGTNYKYIFIASGKEKFNKSNVPKDNSFSRNITNYNDIHYDNYSIRNYDEPYYYLLYNEKTNKYYNIYVRASSIREHNVIYPNILNIDEVE